MTALDADKLRPYARGHWQQILPAHTPIPADVLDNMHHPCPRCGGTDRFRALDDFRDTGAVYCNGCFSKGNGDGFAALMHYGDMDFQSALRIVADHLGTPTNGSSQPHATNGSAKRKKPASAATLSKGIKPISDVGQQETLLAMYAKAKPPITPEGARQCGAELVTWYGNRCIRLNGRAALDDPTTTAVVLLRVEGIPFEAAGKVKERKTHTAKGSINSWLASGDVATAETIIDVEGVTDLLAVVSAGLPAGWVAVTNTAGAKARGNLPRPWAKGKLAIAAGDADDPGEDGKHRSAAAYRQAGAEVRYAVLPYKIEPDHGRDIRDWLNDGHTPADLPTVEASAEAKQAPQRPREQHERLSNAIIVTEADENGEEKTVAFPRPMSELVALIHEHTAGELRRIERALFAHVAGGPMDWIDSPSSLFGYLQSRAGIVEWKGGPGFATKEETYCELQRQSPSFVTVEPLPHWPPIKDHYYTCPIPAPGDGRALTQLVDFHCLETEVDRELTFALYATGIWGGPPGTRPAFLVTAATGRGKGKTRYCQNFARTFGGYLDVSPQEDIGSIKTRFLSPAAAAKRIATLDNLKTPRFSWAEFENFITADTISGKRMYEGDGNRPNFITWTITLNGASLSTDMAQRVVEIRLREPTYTDTWEEQVAAYIDANREKIIADCVGFLQRPAKTMKRHSRWATWEAQVLSKVEHPDDCLSLILDRRGAVDVEQEESEIIEDYFAHKLKWLDYDPERDDVFIPNDMAARWYNEATGEQRKVTGVTRALKQLRDEGRTHRIIYSRTGDRTARGFRWVGEYADAIDVTHYDIRARLADKLQERHQTP